MATRYVDNTIGISLTGTLTFTKDSTAVTGTDTLFTSELAEGNYIKPDTYTEWYKVASITNDTALVLSWAYRQTTASGDTAKYNNKDGQSVTNAFCHLLQAVLDEARTAGDIVYCRRGQTQLYYSVGITLNGEGSTALYITVKGDDGTGWAGETGSAKPIISFGSRAYYNVQFYISSKSFWKFEDLEIKDGNGDGLIHCKSQSNGNYFKDLTIHNEQSSGSRGGMWFEDSSGIRVEGCDFYDNKTSDIYLISANAEIVNCIFNKGGATGGIYAFFIAQAVKLSIKDSISGVTTPHGFTFDQTAPAAGSEIECRNFLMADTAEICDWYTSGREGTFVRMEDYNQVKGAAKSVYFAGIVTKDTGVLHDGGAGSSAKVEPSEKCAVIIPITLSNEFLKGDFALWCPAQATTVTVYIRSLGVWSSYPTNSELYISAEYWNDAGTAVRVESTSSTQVLADETTWVAFTTTFTPVAEGWVYVKVYLNKYEASKGIYVDIKPVVS